MSLNEGATRAGFRVFINKYKWGGLETSAKPACPVRVMYTINCLVTTDHTGSSRGREQETVRDHSHRF